MTDDAVHRPDAEQAMLAVLEAKPGRADDLRRLIDRLAPQVSEEPGCVSFLPFHDREDRSRFYISEVYRDEAAFQRHLRTAHVRTFLAAIADVAIDASMESALRRLDRLASPSTDRSTP